MWNKIKHNRKLKQYLRNLALQVSSPTKQSKILEIVSAKNTETQFFVSENKEADHSLFILAVVSDPNLFAFYGFEFEDKVERYKKEGKEYYKNFVSVFDIWKKGDPTILPDLVQAFWDGEDL